MAWSKETRIKVFIFVDTVFFLLEITTARFSHSLALLADAFHMLNDVISLCVGLWAVKVATGRVASSEYTYGWARAEILGGLVNGVFLIALCLSIVLDAITRLFDPQEVEEPVLVFSVGAVGLLFNFLGLWVFHQHDHSHDDEHEHEHEHGQEHGELGEPSHSHGQSTALPKKSLFGRIRGLFRTKDSNEHMHSEHDAEEGQIPSETTPLLTSTSQDDHSSPQLSTRQTTIAFSDSHTSVDSRANDSTSGQTHAQSAGSVPIRRRSVKINRRRAVSQNSFLDFSIHPQQVRSEIISQARSGDGYSDSESSSAEGDQNQINGIQRETGTSSEIRSKHYTTSYDTGGPILNGDSVHQNHHHKQPRKKVNGGSWSFKDWSLYLFFGIGGGGHSHGDMNIRGMFLHVLGDAFGNVGVMLAALTIWQDTLPGDWRLYADPVISLVITIIILRSAVPLCIETAKPLLQAAPADISVDEIREDIESLPGIRACHHLHVWCLTPTRRVATLHAQMNYSYDTEQYMRTAKEIKTCLREFGIHSSTIQPEFQGDTGFCQLDAEDSGEDAKKCCTPPNESSLPTPTGATDVENSAVEP